MIAWLGKSIQRKMAASFVVIFLATYGFTALVVFTSVSQIARQTEADTLSQIANQKLGQVIANLNALGTNLSAWSRLGVMNDIFSGDIDKRIFRTLQQLRTQYALNGQIYVFDGKGQFVASSGEPTSKLELPALWVPNGSAIKFIDKHATPLQAQQDSLSQADFIAVLSFNIFANFNAKTPIGTIVATVPWQDIQQTVFSDVRPIFLADLASGRLLHGGNGLPVTDANRDALTAQPLSLTIMDQAFIFGYSDLHAGNMFGWSAVALKTEKEANEPVRDVAVQLLLLGLILVLPVGIAIRWLSLMLTRPLHSLEQTVSDVARDNNLSLRATVTTEDEIGILAGAFNSMAANLDAASLEREDVLKRLELLNTTLEKRVSERTSELQAAHEDVTKAFDQLKSTQSQLVQSEKMASLGQLVAGVAHELNNPIGFIYANFPHLDDYADEIFQLFDDIQALEMPDSSKEALAQKFSDYDIAFIKDDLRRIITSGKSGASRIKEIVSSLRSFSRLDEGELKSVRLEDGLDDTLLILNHYLKGGVEVEKKYELKHAVTCRAGQINQVFTNIIFNAIQAMNEKGQLTITTRRDADFAVIEIADTGGGIPADILDRIFDPFFTTKKVGEGTGLGLSISYGIIDSHGGKLAVESRVGEGTTFTIRIPIDAVETL